MWYVYELIDPRNGRVFYVGKGKGKRIDQHEQEARKHRHGAKNLLIQDIEGEGYQIIKRKVAEFDDEAKAYAFEKKHIEELGFDSLTNSNKGGGGYVSFVPKVRKPRKTKDEIDMERLGTRVFAAKFLMRKLNHNNCISYGLSKLDLDRIAEVANGPRS